MNNEFLFLIKEQLHNNCSAAYLYGSQMKQVDPDKDIDIAIVCMEQEIIAISQVLNNIQVSIQQLIHPIFLTHEDVSRNPGFKKIVSDGLRII